MWGPQNPEGSPLASAIGTAALEESQVVVFVPVLNRRSLTEKSARAYI